VQTLQAELGLLVDADRQKQERLAKLQTQLNTARGGTSGRLGASARGGKGTPRFHFGNDVMMLGAAGGLVLGGAGAIGCGPGGFGPGLGGCGGCLGAVPGMMGGAGGPGGGAAGGLAPPPIMAPPPIGGACGAPPPPPIAGGAPPPPPMIGGPPPPPPPPGMGGPKPPGAPPGPLVAKAKPNKPQVHPTAKMKALHWKRIILEPPGSSKDGDKDKDGAKREKQFWELVKEPKFDVEQFEEMFSQKTTAKETEAKKESKNSTGVSKVAFVGGATQPAWSSPAPRLDA